MAGRATAWVRTHPLQVTAGQKSKSNSVQAFPWYILGARKVCWGATSPDTRGVLDPWWRLREDRGQAPGTGRSSPAADSFEQCERRDRPLWGVPPRDAVWAGLEGRPDPTRESLRVRSALSPGRW